MATDINSLINQYKYGTAGPTTMSPQQAGTKIADTRTGREKIGNFFGVDKNQSVEENAGQIAALGLGGPSTKLGSNLAIKGISKLFGRAPKALPYITNAIVPYVEKQSLGFPRSYPVAAALGGGTVVAGMMNDRWKKDVSASGPIGSPTTSATPPASSNTASGGGGGTGTSTSKKSSAGSTSGFVENFGGPGYRTEGVFKNVEDYLANKNTVLPAIKQRVGLGKILSKTYGINAGVPSAEEIEKIQALPKERRLEIYQENLASARALSSKK